MRRLNLLGLCLCALPACGGDDADPRAPMPPALTLRQVAAGLDFPVFLSAPASDARQFIVERAGRIRVVENGQLLPAPFLDMRAHRH